jgi:hypothetical protein
MLVKLNILVQRLFNRACSFVTRRAVSRGCKAFTREMVAVTDAGWVSFKWRNPLTKAARLKITYNVRVGDDVVSVRAYAK